MSSISKAGIFIDVKQLLVFTQRMKEAMNVADRINYGDRLVGYNLDMITSFSLAYHRRDEHIIFTADGKTYDINLKGEKRKHVDDLEAAFDAYQALMEFCFENLDFKLKKRKRRRRHNQFMGTHGENRSWNSQVERKHIPAGLRFRQGRRSRLKILKRWGRIHSIQSG